MNKLKQIQAFFLLSIISILMFHTSVPHVHHIHTSKKLDTHVHLDDHHDHHNHHEHDSSHTHGKDSNFLDDLMDELAHGIHSDEYLSGDQPIQFNFLGQIDLFPFIDFTYTALLLSPQEEKTHLHRYALYKQGHYSCPYLNAYTLRGPPFLG